MKRQEVDKIKFTTTFKKETLDKLEVIKTLYNVDKTKKVRFYNEMLELIIDDVYDREMQK